MSQHLMNTYARQPISFVRGEGVWLIDAEGNRYLDALAGVAVTGERSRDRASVSGRYRPHQRLA